MSSFGGLLGLKGGVNGTGFAGPSLADISNPTTQAQVQASYGGAQNSLQSQQALMQALQQQNGLGNQSQVYNQLQGVAAGQGPNPAQNMLNQATGQNVQNQAALMAGQRGIGANTGLLARQIGQQGAGIQQNAAGQAATMQSQQSLNALGLAGGLANQQTANQIGAVGANTNANLAEQGQLLGAQGQFNQQQLQNQQGFNNINAGFVNQGMQGQQGLIGGLIGGAGTVGAAAAGAAHGGMIEGYAQGGSVSGMPPQVDFLNNWQPAMMSKGGPVDAVVSPGEKFLDPGQVQQFAMGGKEQALERAATIPGKAPVAGDSKKNDIVPAKLPPGGIVVPRTDANNMHDAAKFVSSVLARKKGKR